MLASLRSLSLRVGRWPRLLAAGACLLLAALSAATAAHDRAAAARPSRTAAVVVTVRPIGSAQVVHARDVRVEQWPARLRPPGAAPRLTAVVGRRAAGALGVGEPVTAARLVGRGLTTGLAAGVGGVPLPVDDDQAVALVHAGDRVDVIAGPASDAAGLSATTSPPAAVLASEVAVLAVLHDPETRTGTVVVAADRATALRLARARTTTTFTIVLVSA